MKHLRLLLPIAFPLILLGLFFTSLQIKASPSATFTVNSTVDAVDANPGNSVCETAVAGQCTLRAAVMEANAFPGKDMIQLPSGNYLLTLLGEDENSSATGDLDITEDLLIIGADQTTTIIDGNQADRIFHIFYVTTFISNLTVTNGIGGILNAFEEGYPLGNLTLDMVNISNNRSKELGSNPYFNGGGIKSWGPLTVTNSLIQSNFNFGGGGGIEAGSTLYVENSIVSNNVAYISGGGIAAYSIRLINSVIDSNKLEGDEGSGGGLSISYPSTIEGSTISNNSIIQGKGGGVFIGANASITITHATIISNSVYTPIGNTAPRGGGIYSESNQQVVIMDTSVTGNTSDYDGGGIYNNPFLGGGEMLLNRVTINQNRTKMSGAGIYNSGTLSLSNVTVAENLTGETLNGRGGGIYQTGVTSLTLLNSTVTKNEAQYGGGIYQNAGSVTLENTILANNTAYGLIFPGNPNTHNCAGIITSMGHNLEDGSDCDFASSGDLSNLNPLLVSTTSTNGEIIYRPIPISPVIDAGSDANCPEVDQRLVIRPIDGDNDGIPLCDIGSVEYDPLKDIFYFTFLPNILK